MKLIPYPKKIEEKSEKFQFSAIKIVNLVDDERVNKAAAKLPFHEDGAELSINIGKMDGEGYKLILNNDEIILDAESNVGAFYGIQTLRQIFENEEIPCVEIEDAPDFEHRSFFHDITNGQVQTVETLKALVDKAAYFKLNSLQLYVEHAFEYKELGKVIQKTGYITKEEIRELDTYCRENFIDLVPALGAFGHLYELLEQEEFSHLRDIDKDNQHFWYNRMFHHTLNPELPESLELAKSLIDQYSECFTSEYINIGCDETFDLYRKNREKETVGELYVKFVKELVNHVKGKGKIPMVWSDVLLQHPETVKELPEDVIFLNWNYSQSPDEEGVKFFENVNRTQAVCSGTWDWSRVCENTDWGTKNITKLTEYGKKYGAWGLVNTHWGDTGNLCVSLDLTMYGFAVGASRSWNSDIYIDCVFDECVNLLLYKNQNGVKYIKELSDIMTSIDGVMTPRGCDDTHLNRAWNMLVSHWSNVVLGSQFKIECPQNEVYINAHSRCKELINQLSAEKWEKDQYRQAMAVAAEGIAWIIETFAKIQGLEIERITSAEKWLENYKKLWLSQSKASELFEIEKFVTFMESL